MSNATQHSILIVDDEPKNLQVLGSFLENEQYEISFAQNGSRALELIGKFPPDLILLDIMMPGMSGLEVCRHLQNSLDDPPPVIFLTAKAQPEDIIEGFQAGAVDYVSKPFSSEELLARVRTQLELRHIRQSLHQKNQTLEQLVSDKTELLSIASHDIKNPVSGISGCSKAILDAVADSDSPNHLEPDFLELLQIVTQTADRVLDIVHNILDTQNIESQGFQLQYSYCNFHDLLRETIALNQAAASKKDITLHLELPPQGMEVSLDISCIRDVIDNLISNAVKYSPLAKEIFCTLQEGPDNSLEFSVRDQGPGLTDLDKSQLFGKFKKLSARPTAGESSTGLGLSITKKIVELHHGSIWADSIHGQGATFTIRLPRQAP